MMTDIVKNDKLWPMVQNYDIPLNKPYHMDLRIVLTWDMDMTDLELRVVEPTGEICHSFYNQTNSGGMLTKDMCGGYGPEVYQIRNAPKGTYRVQVKLFASKGRLTTYGVTAMVRLYTKYGTAEECEYLHMLRLREDKETVDVAQIVL